MFQKLYSLSGSRLMPELITIEVDILAGMPFMNLLGIPEVAARGIRERLRSALASVGLPVPARKITVNLISTFRPLTADGLDLPIAVGLLCADQILPSERNEKAILVGSLSLNGDILPVTGIAGRLSALQERLIEQGFREVLIPAACAREVSCLQGLSIIPVSTLEEVIRLWRGHLTIPPCPFHPIETAQPSLSSLLSIRGQFQARRALQVACTGFHNLLLCGPPGCGKTLLARAAPSLLPPPDAHEIQRIFKLWELSGAFHDGVLTRPVRTPHHSITTHALIGGGHPVQPGELTLADGGLLIADEIAEFSHNVLENLRQPLESHVVSLSYLGESYQFPADFMLIATMNLCPCGQFPNTELCTCLPSAVRRYQSRLSFPLLERIEMGLTLEPVPEEEQTCCTEEEALQIRDAILQAAQRQRIRYAEETFSWNSRIPPSLLETYCPLEKDAKALLEAAASRFGFSLRTQHNCIKTARSIADLAGSELILREHMAEALLYRPRGFVTP